MWNSLKRMAYNEGTARSLLPPEQPEGPPRKTARLSGRASEEEMTLLNTDDEHSHTMIDVFSFVKENHEFPPVPTVQVGDQLFYPVTQMNGSSGEKIYGYQIYFPVKKQGEDKPLQEVEAINSSVQYAAADSTISGSDDVSSDADDCANTADDDDDAAEAVPEATSFFHD